MKKNKNKKILFGLILGATGIVFGDIGTSPLYAFSAAFGSSNHGLSVNRNNIVGIISLLLWSLMLEVSLKFVGFIMKADNEGEGGILALVGLIKGSNLKKYKWFFISLGIIGVAMFYGDSVITPSISVLSAVSGITVLNHSLSNWILPISLVILLSLFLIQKLGSYFIGKLFGPVMLVWFLAIAAGGIYQILKHPVILKALSPYQAIHFFAAHPLAAFLSMGIVILAITGAEALFADLGHFGRPAISRSWFFVVLPSLVLCYMGEGALVIANPHNVTNPLFLLYPSFLRLPMVVLATLATVIASQAVISGAFSLTYQAVQLGFLPKMLIKHTSAKEFGQIYIGSINIIMFILVASISIIFKNPNNLSQAYGVAVSITLLMDSLLYLVVITKIRPKKIWQVTLLAIIFIPIDVLFVSSNIPKFLKGGWFPVVISLVVITIISTWLRGQKVVTKERRRMEGTLEEFVEMVHQSKQHILRVPGVAVYMSHHEDLTPLALKATLDELHELHRHVVIVYVEITTKAHVAVVNRANISNLGYDDGIVHVVLKYGYRDKVNVPEELALLESRNTELEFSFNNAAYFISLSRVVPSNRHNLMHFRKVLYCFLSANSLSTTDYYHLPVGRTIEMRTLINL